MKALWLTIFLALAGCSSFAPGYVFRPVSETLNATTARGAVIYSHGTTPTQSGKEGSDQPLPILLDNFQADGWDIYRLDRTRLTEEKYDAADKLVSTVRDLRVQGYKRIVLVGQSGGAWISLIAAGQTTDVDLVIALAPAIYGSNYPGNMQFVLNQTDLYPRLEKIRHGFIVVAFFNNDPFDQQGRSDRVDPILTSHAVGHMVIDHPPQLTGHGAGRSKAFADRFGACLVRLADDGAVPVPCDTASTQAKQRG